MSAEIDVVDTVDMTPTWEGLMPGLLHVVANGSTAKGREAARDEIMRLARNMDRMIADQKKGQ